MIASEKLIQLYVDMSAHTLPECTNNCRIPFSCCSTSHCEEIIQFAQEEMHVELKRTDHPKLPLMGPTGCTAAPYLRPSCALHTCAINGLGFKPNDQPWTDKYFQIRGQIMQEEYECRGFD